MESVIIDATPKGSAILAYGKAPQSRFRFVWIGAVIAAGLIVIALVVMMVILRSIPLPPHRLITIAAAPAKVGTLLSTDQISDLPPSWRAAVRTGKTSPALFGIALGDDGRPVTFAFVFGSVLSSGAPQTVHESFRTLLIDASSTSLERASVPALLPLFFDLRHSDASWVIGADELRAFVGTDASDTKDGQTIRGRWANGRGELDLSAPGMDAESAEPSPFVVVLGGDERGSDVVKSAFIAQGVDIRGVSAPIQSASFIADPFAVRATFTAPLGADDARALRAAFGQASIRTTNLVDATITTEMIVPTSTEVDNQASFIMTDATGTAGIPGSGKKTSCEGTSILHLDGPVLANTLNAVGIPASLSKEIGSFDMTQSGGRTLVCLGG